MRRCRGRHCGGDTLKCVECVVVHSKDFCGCCEEV